MTGTRRLANKTIRLRMSLNSLREKLAFLLDKKESAMTPRQRSAQLRRLGVTASQLLREAIVATESAADFGGDGVEVNRLREVAGIVMREIDGMVAKHPAMELWQAERAAMRRHIEMVK